MFTNLSLSEKELFLLFPKTAAFIHAFEAGSEQDVQILLFPLILPLPFPLRTVSGKAYQDHKNKTKRCK